MTITRITEEQKEAIRHYLVNWLDWMKQNTAHNKYNLVAEAVAEILAILQDAPEVEVWPSPTPEMLQTPEFEAVWQCIKSWDINVPHVYRGYCGANGNHVRAILDALNTARIVSGGEV